MDERNKMSKKNIGKSFVRLWTDTENVYETFRSLDRSDIRPRYETHKAHDGQRG